MTKDQALALASARLRMGGEPEHDPYTMENIVGSAVEPLMALGTGAVTMPVAGLAGLGAMGAEALGADVDPAGVVREIQEAGTYQPRTKGGQIATEAITYPFQKLHEGAKYLGGKTLRATDSPAAATAVQTGIEMIPAAFGMKGVKRSDAARFPEVEKTVRLPVTGVEKVGSALVNLAEPMLKGGSTRVAGRAAREVAGERAPAVIEALTKAKTGETAGQAALPAGSYEFAALQKLAEAKRPSEFGEVSAAQQTARKQAIETVGKTKPELNKAIQDRKVEADKLYTAARESADPVNTVPILEQVNTLIGENPGNPALLVELNKIRKGISKREQGSFAPRTDAKAVISTIEGIKGALKNKDNSHIVKELTNIKNQLSESMPLYAEADALFAEMSVPINRMKIGQSLEKSLDPKLGAQERATTFSTALEKANETVKSSTGRDTPITEILTEPQMKVIDAVKTQLDKDAILKQQATKGVASVKEKLGTAIPDVTKGFNVLERGVVIAKSILERLHGKASKESMEIIAKKMQDPKQMAELMKNATANERSALMAVQPILGGAVATAENR